MDMQRNNSGFLIITDNRNDSYAYITGESTTLSHSMYCFSIAIDGMLFCQWQSAVAIIVRILQIYVLSAFSAPDSMRMALSAPPSAAFSAGVT